jgi:hypothetical protein
VRQLFLLALLFLSSCSSSSNGWSDVDAWASEQPGLRLVDAAPNARTYAYPNVGQFGSTGVLDSYILLKFDGPSFPPRHWIKDVDCQTNRVDVYSSDAANGAIRRDILGDVVFDSNNRPFRSTEWERPATASEKKAFCRRDWTADRAAAHRAMIQLRQDATG